MNVASLDPITTGILFHLGAEEHVVAVSHLCPTSSGENLPSIVTAAGAVRLSGNQEMDRLMKGLSPYSVDVQALQRTRPNLIVCSCTSEDSKVFCRWAEEYLLRMWERRVSVESVAPIDLESLLSAYRSIGTMIGKGSEGQDLAQRIKSQVLDWGRNLYERLRNKKVVVLSSLKPLKVAGGWVPDLIRAISARPYPIEDSPQDVDITWQDVKAFMPDVILVAPRGFTVEESVKSLRSLEEAPEWDSLPATKRGEVVFSAGTNLYSAGGLFLEGVAVLISAIGALESGYITKKDEFHRLRFVELHRHRFL